MAEDKTTAELRQQLADTKQQLDQLNKQFGEEVGKLNRLIQVSTLLNATLPFMPFPFGHEAIDVVRLNPDDYQIVKDPFSGRDVVVIRPLNPDFGLIHVPVADEYGNVRIELGGEGR